MEKLHILCIVTVLLPDDGDIKSHAHRFIGLSSSSPKYAFKNFTRL